MLEKINPSFTSSKEVLNTKNLELSSLQVKRVVESISLYGEGWISWHCLAVKRLGPARYLELADIAKTGKTPETLFSWLIKKELCSTGSKSKTAIKE